MSQQNKTTLQSCINAQLADNSTGNITAANVRNNLINITDSLLFNSGSQSITGSLVVTGSNGTINGLFFGRGGGNEPSNVSIGSTTNFNSSASGIGNTAIGYSALQFNTSGSHNTAIGNQALKDNTLGSHNTAIGNQALFYNTSGSYNTAIGRSAL